MSNCTVNPVLSRTANALADAVAEMVEHTRKSLDACGMDVSKFDTFPDFRQLDPDRVQEAVEEISENSDNYLTPADASQAIGAGKFNTRQFASDIGDVAELFGFDKSLLFKDKDEDAIYKKSLSALDTVLSIAQLMPLDTCLDEAKETLSVISMGIRSYLPKLEQISEILANAPGLNRYAKVLVGIGSSLDETIEILASDDEDAVSTAIDQLRSAIKRLKKLSIKDINKEAANIIIEMEPVENANDDNDQASKKSKKILKGFYRNSKGEIVRKSSWNTFDDEEDEEEDETPKEKTPSKLAADKPKELKPAEKAPKDKKPKEKKEKADAAESKKPDKAEPKKPTEKPVEKTPANTGVPAPGNNGWMVSQDAIQDAIAMQQSILDQINPAARAKASMADTTTWGELDPSNGYAAMDPMTQWYAMQDASTVPMFMDPSLVRNEDGKAVPEFIEQNSARVPTTPVEQQIFAKVNQEKTAQIMQLVSAYPWLRDIHQVANQNGYFVDAIPSGPLKDSNTVITVLVFNNQGYLPDKSFIVDTGCVIDRRPAIWPCCRSDGSFKFFEECDEAFYLLNREGKVNVEFIEKIIKYGFTNLDSQTKKAATVYGDRMIKANRKFVMISLDSVRDLDSKTRSRLRGALIRATNQISKELPNAGRFVVTSVNPKTMEMKLTNFNVPTRFGDQAPQRSAITELTFTPKKDDDGKFIKVDDKGTDIQFNLTMVERNILAS